MGWRRPLRASSALIIMAGLLTVCASAVAMPAHGSAERRVAPRAGRAWGLVGALGQAGVITMAGTPLVYHGGPVMHGVHVHAVFWAPAGYAFEPAPTPAAPSYEELIERFFADAASPAGAPATVFSVLGEYGDRSGPGADAVRYDPTRDTIDDGDPYPPAVEQCASLAGLAACLSAPDLEAELDRVVARRDPAGRGLGDLWVLLLPPDVDACLTGPECGTSAFAGYHSLFDLGHGATVYAVVVNPLIEGVPPQGMDPEGNPVAEVAADVAAHEAVEAATDPEGTGWIDPAGGEVGDKCQASTGALLGYAADGAPYNQLLSGDPFLLQTMWSNAAAGCAGHGAPAPGPALASVALRQFSPVVRGRSAVARSGVAVHVALLRAGTAVGQGLTRTDAAGGWALTLRTRAGAPVSVGDDRDEIDVRYGPGGGAAEQILTGQGGNPEGQAGFTGWTTLDSGFALNRGQLAIAPCAQVGVLAVTVDGRDLPSPVPACQTAADMSVVPTGRVGASSVAVLSSTDNRASTPANPAGALVSLSVALGEPDSIAGPSAGASVLEATGFPACTADLTRQSVLCTGLVARGRYRLGVGALARWARADRAGRARWQRRGRWVSGGNVVTLRNDAGRILTTLHVAHLRVGLDDAGRVLAGDCQPGQYWGPAGPPTSPLPSLFGLLFGSAPASMSIPAVCPLSGRAAGLPGGVIEQSDDGSAGLTSVTVPRLGLVSPANGATLYGPFLAVARPASIGAAAISVAFTRAGVRRPALRLGNVAGTRGESVRGLPAGLYRAVWTLTDANGDTRTLHTYFVSEP